MRIILQFILIPIVFSSCCFEADCDQGQLNPIFVSFTDAEIDTLVFRRYEIGSNFQTKKDSFFISRINLLFPNRQGDSVFMSLSQSLLFQIKPSYQYEIFVPSLNKTYQISNIIEKSRDNENAFLQTGHNNAIIQ